MFVAEATRAYQCWISDRYPLRSGQGHRIATALEAVDRLFGELPADQFDSLNLQAVRDYLLNRTSKRDPRKKLCRNYVNSLIGTVQTAWDWLAAQKLVPTSAADNLRKVRSIRAGFGGVEAETVIPVTDQDVAATLPKLNHVVAAMVRLQRLTGMRPGEVCIMRRCDLATRTDETLRPANSPPVTAKKIGEALVWFYAPSDHKNKAKGKPRLIALGPQAQSLLKPFLDREQTAYLFSPREGRQSWQGKPGKRSPGSRAGNRYTTQSYGRSIRYACERAQVPVWAPNRLRHAAASAVADAEQFDLASDLLGHSTPSTTSVYVSRLLGRLAVFAAKCG
jgi:integrase